MCCLTQIWTNATEKIEITSVTYDKLEVHERDERPRACKDCNMQLVISASGKFREQFNLYYFPFDRQYLSIKVDSFRNE